MNRNRGPRQHDQLTLFAYGSLLTGFWNHRPFAPWLVGCEPGSVTGLRLVHLPAGYPAAFTSSVPEDRILGELQTFRSRARVLRALDAMEDYAPDAPEESMYVRREVLVQRPAGLAPVEAWCYLYAASGVEEVLEQGGIAIPSGDWRAFMGG